MPSIAYTALEWHTVPMPGGNMGVAVAQLPALDDGAFRAFVRFPAGWTRPAAGHYSAAEEFLVLAGNLTLNGTTWHAGGYARIPAGRVRTGSRSAAGCVAFAWFGGPPRWRDGEPAAPAIDAGTSFAHWRDAPERDLEDGIRARELHAGPPHTTLLIEQPAPESLAALGAARETLCIADRMWSWIEAGEPVGRCAGPLLVRVDGRTG